MRKKRGFVPPLTLTTQSDSEGEFVSEPGGDLPHISQVSSEDDSSEASDTELPGTQIVNY
jgi:hypothetical protein